MRIVFMGTPEFAVPSLQALLDSHHEVIAVFTQPDRPKGRGNKLTPSPVKVLAAAHGVPVYQPEKIRRESVETLKELAPDAYVTAAFGQILSQELLDIPAKGCINVHASLLPRHRGSAPINWAIMQGDAETGVTTMLTERGIDTGAMLMKAATPIGEMETAGQLTERLSHTGASLLLETLEAIEQGTMIPQPQNEAAMTYDPMLTREMGVVDWTKSGREIADLIRGLNPAPGASTMTAEGRLKLHLARAVEGSGKPGEVLVADPKQGFIVACGTCAVKLEQVQAPGGKPMAAADYLRGHAVPVGTILGEVVINE